MFINRHERSDVIKDCNNFLKKIEELKTYRVEFKKDETIKAKTYRFDYKIRRPKKTPNYSNYLW